LSAPEGVAVDSAGNVWIADTGDNTIDEWNAATGGVTPLVSSGLSGPTGVAVDGGGNVFIADTGNNAIEEWSALNQQVSTVVSGLNGPAGVAVDVADNVYIADTKNNAFEELVSALVPANPISAGAAAGSGNLGAVLPTTQVLAGVFAPTSNQSWLTFNTSANGEISFSFTANNGTTPRTAIITWLGQPITVTQAVSAATEASTAFVTALYQDVLGRTPDSGGLAIWVQLLQNGTSRQPVAQGFWDSAEHLTLEVESYYSTYLHRQADAPGLAFWVSQLQAGVTENQVILGFLTAVEYTGEHADGNSLINDLYSDILGRAPEAAGLAYWENVYRTTGAGGELAVVQGILNSAEADQRILDNCYAQYLGRTPDPQGDQFWLNALEAGTVSPAAVAQAFLASDEFFTLVTTPPS
jgi:hypothetical protein